MKKLAIITSHPIQYNAPWFKLLSERNIIKIKVFYTWSQIEKERKYDPGFDKAVEWDIPLLEGYQYTFVKNTSADPGSHHRKGIINPTLNKEIEDWQPDALLVFGWNFISHLNCIRYFHKRFPIIFRGDSTLLDEKKSVKTVLRRIFLNWVYSYIDFSLYVGKNNQQYFLKHGLASHQLIYAAHAIDNDRFAEPDNLYETQANEYKVQLGIKKNDIILLFAGKLEVKKNPFFLVQLLKKHTDPRLKVIFVGNGKLEASLKAAALEDKRILFLDFKNQLEMPGIYRLANLVVLPSAGPGETWGLALNEAMACGKAVSASYKTGGAIDLIQDGENGVLINLVDTSSLDQLIEESLLDENVLKNMGKVSKIRISQFSFLNIAQALEILLLSF